MAARGPLPLFGDGSAPTNPIDERDLAALAVDLVEGPARDEDCGGPETLPRRQIGETVFKVLGKPARFRSVPPGPVRAMGVLVRPFQPRIGALLSFYAHVNTHACVAPIRGKRTFEAFLREGTG